MALYFFKSESEISNALCQAERKIKTQKIRLREATYKIAHAFANTGQDSVQEVTHLCLPELWLKTLSPSVLYVNINTPSKRLRMLKLEKKSRTSRRQQWNI